MSYVASHLKVECTFFKAMFIPISNWSKLLLWGWYLKVSQLLLGGSYVSHLTIVENPGRSDLTSAVMLRCLGASEEVLTNINLTADNAEDISTYSFSLEKLVASSDPSFGDTGRPAI